MEKLKSYSKGERILEESATELFLKLRNAGADKDKALRYVTHIMARALDVIQEMENQTIN